MLLEHLYLVSEFPIKCLPGSIECGSFDPSQGMLCMRTEMDQVAINDD